MKLELIQHVYPLLMGPLVAGLVETAKRVPVVPFTGQQKAAVVAALVLVSFIVRVGLAWATDGLGTLDWDTELRLVVDSIMSAFVAAGGYSLLRR